MTKVPTFLVVLLCLSFSMEADAQRVLIETDKGDICITDNRDKDGCPDAIVLFGDDDYMVKIDDREVKASAMRVRISKTSEADRKSTKADIFVDVHQGLDNSDGVTSEESSESRGAQDRAVESKTAHDKMGGGGASPAMRTSFENICFVNKRTKEMVCLETIMKIRQSCMK